MCKLPACRLAVLVAMVAATLLLYAVPPAHADVVALRVKQLRSPAGFNNEADSITCEYNESKDPVVCRGLCNMTAAGPQECLMGVNANCQRTSSGDWCIMQVDIEADMNADPDDSDRRAHAYVQAHPIIRVRRISGPSYSKPSGQPFYKAKWTFELATAVAGNWQRPKATFVAQQDSQARVVSASVYPGCTPMEASKQSISFSTPTVNCKTGRLEATAKVTGCPDFFFPNYEEQNSYLEVFDGSITANPYTGNVNSDLSNIYRTFDDENVWRTLSTTGPGAIKAVFERPQPNVWPAGVTKIRLGYRFNKGDDPVVWDPLQQNTAEPFTWRMTGATSMKC